MVMQVIYIQTKDLTKFEGFETKEWFDKCCGLENASVYLSIK